MTSNESAVVKSKSYASNRISIFGPPPLLEGEDENAYNELLAHVSGAVKPGDIIEEIWIRDIVDLTWEIFRWRALKTKHLPDVVSPDPLNVFECDFSKIERVDRLITIAEGRRNAALREMDRRRSTLAQTLRDKVKNVDDAEFKTIETKAIADKNGTCNEAA